jgi:hypothetical protein
VQQPTTRESMRSGSSTPSPPRNRPTSTAWTLGERRSARPAFPQHTKLCPKQEENQKPGVGLEPTTPSLPWKLGLQRVAYRCSILHATRLNGGPFADRSSGQLHAAQDMVMFPRCSRETACISWSVVCRACVRPALARACGGGRTIASLSSVGDVDARRGRDDPTIAYRLSGAKSRVHEHGRAVPQR